MNENNVRGHSNTGEDVEKRWFAPVNRIGQFTLTIVQRKWAIIGNDSNLLIVFYVQIMPDDLVMQLHRF